MKHTSLTLLVSAALLSACSQQNLPQMPPQMPQTPQLQQPTPQVPQPQPEAQEPQQQYVAQAITNPLDIPNKKLPGYKNPYEQGTYEYFVAQPDYPTTMAVYLNEDLLKQLTPANSKIIVCIPQQRCRVYVNGKVAYDWPVSTGTKGHETPTGVFRVLQKEPDHKSNRYGKFIGKNGKTLNGNADLNSGDQPGGSSFEPASMPYWNRLTWDGVGIHAGRVRAGQRLSHGCIRTPNAVAKKFYEYSALNMPAYITRAVEDYNRGGAVKPIDVKYRPTPGNDYTDMAPVKKPETAAPQA